MTDAQRLDFLARLMDASVRKTLVPLATKEMAWLQDRSLAVLNRYEFHRRTNDMPTSFRLAVDDASGGAGSSPEAHEDQVVVTLAIKTRIYHTAARGRLADLLNAVRQIADELDEFATLRIVGAQPEKHSQDLT